jgi:hypothetical protein
MVTVVSLYYKCLIVRTGTNSSPVLLRNATWKTIRDAVQNTRDIVVNLENDMRFRLVWEKTVYHNPIDGKEYKASSNPIVPDPLNSHVQMSEIIFLVEPPRGDVDVQETSAYVLQVVEVLKQLIPVRPIPMQEGGQAGRQMIVEIEMPKCEGWLKMSAYPSMEGLPSQQILPEIARIVQPRAMSRVKFQLLINLWGYQGPPAHFS